MDRIIKALGYSVAGLKACFQSEAAFRQELFLAVIISPVILFIDRPLASKALLVMSVLLILITELVNTAIEVVVDRISEEKHPLSKKAKDIGSAMVLLAFINAALVWAIILS